MKLPKVSVIIPNYNHGKFLKKRIESVLNQTFNDFELIILDDCSTDGSKAIIKEYENAAVVKNIIFNEINSGSPFKQWELGIECARGEWIWIAESDDYADERFLESLLSALPKNHNVGLIYCDSVIVSKDEFSGQRFSSLKNKRFDTTRWSFSYHNNGVDEIENYLLPGGTINNSSAVLFNKDVLQTSNPFDLSLKYVGDKYAFIKVLMGKDVLYINEALNFYHDPFNAKHRNKMVHYFHEQFLVFDYVYKNMEVNDRKKFFDGFYENTNNSLVRNWDITKLEIHKELLFLNPHLFSKNIYYNIKRTFNRFFLIKND